MIRALRVAALVKQVPATDRLRLDEAGRLVRGIEHEMNAFCRRAVTQAIVLARNSSGRSVAFTMGPPSAEDVLREAVACGVQEAVHVCDPAFAGSDTLVTARALVASLEREGPFDLVLVGRGSADSETGSIGPQVAQLMGLPFAGPVRSLRTIDGGTAVDLDVEAEGVTERVRVRLPAVLSAAERLCAAAREPPESWPAAFTAKRYKAGDLGPGPWGLDGSPTRVGAAVRRMEPDRRAVVLAHGDLARRVRLAVDMLVEQGAFTDVERPPKRVPRPRSAGPAVVAMIGQGVDTEARALLGAAARLAAEIDGHVVAVCDESSCVATLGGWGADAVLLAPCCEPAPLVESLAEWARGIGPWTVLGTATTWGREVLARFAAALEAGLIADALALRARDGRLIGDKPAFSGQLTVEIHCTSAVQCATVRPGALPLLLPRTHTPWVQRIQVAADPCVRLLARAVHDAGDALARAKVVIGVGRGVHPSRYPLLDPLLDALNAELGATRKVTDKGWLPHIRQIGTTGRAVAPRLYVALGISGDPTHTAGVRGAGSIVAVNSDPQARIFRSCDVGIVADWKDVVPLLDSELTSRGLTSTAA
jgi:electron transfer flavoprotein alpha subunit